jgi:hypothetical protein
MRKKFNHGFYRWDVCASSTPSPLVLPERKWDDFEWLAIVVLPGETETGGVSSVPELWRISKPEVSDEPA